MATKPPTSYLINIFIFGGKLFDLQKKNVYAKYCECFTTEKIVMIPLIKMILVLTGER